MAALKFVRAEFNLFFPNLNSRYKRPYKHFSNTYQCVLAQVSSAKTLHMNFSSSAHFSHSFKCCAKLRLASVAPIFLSIVDLHLSSLCLLLLYGKPQNGFEFYLKVKKTFPRSPNYRLLEKESQLASSTTVPASVSKTLR